MRSGKGKSNGMWVLIGIAGAIIGGVLGELLADSALFAGAAPYLVKNHTIIDLPPVSVNLYVVKIMFGFVFQPNLISIMGIVAAVFLFRRF